MPISKTTQSPLWHGKRVGVVTLGCARNTVDSEKILADARRLGAVICPPEKASTVILNTCAFTQEAKEESIAAIAQLEALKKKGRIREIVVAGCLAKRYKEELRAHFKAVDAYAGLSDFKTAFDPEARLTPFFSAYVKIAEGCANRCSFCAIPLIKGPLRSRPQTDIVKEVRFLEKQGVRELNIVGQDITLYGFKEGRGRRASLPLTWLLREVLRGSSIPWIRLLYLHPRRVTDDLIELIARESRICPYIDLPLQHINNWILRLMNRGIAKEEVSRLIKRIRRRIPGVALRTSLIVGFPTETKREFRELYDFVAETRFDRMGVFLYSREEGTAAYHFRPQVTSRVMRERRDALMTLQARISAENLRQAVGSEIEVLVERKEGSAARYVGRSRKDAPDVDGVVLIRSSRPLEPGIFARCRVTGATTHDLRCEVIR